MGNYRSKQQYEHDPVLLEDPDMWRIQMSSVGLYDFPVHRFLALPFIIIRWQCQIGAWSNESHISPMSVAPLIYNFVAKYPVQAFFRGLYAVLTLNWAVADLFNAMFIHCCRTGLPRFGYHYDNWNAKLGHYRQKFLAAVFAGPVYAAMIQVMVQAAQSSVFYNVAHFGMLVASRYFVWGLPTSDAPMMPFWIVGPLHGAYYTARLIIVSNCYFELFIWMKSCSDKRRHLAESRGARPLTGTGAMIDSLAAGAEEIPIAFLYTGPFHCVMDILQTSGIVGFYQDVGYVFLQGLFYVAVFGVLHLTLKLFETGIDKKLQALEQRAQLGRMLMQPRAQRMASEEQRLQANLDYVEQKRMVERLKGYSA